MMARILLLLTLGILTPLAGAQELTPRAYWPSPVGTKIVVLAYLQSTSLAGRSASVTVELPYSDGKTSGVIDNQPASGKYSGLSDLAVTLAINLVGAPSMDREQFRALRADPHQRLGASIKVLAPTGTYHSDKLLNVSGNRLGDVQRNSRLGATLVVPFAGRHAI